MSLGTLLFASEFSWIGNRIVATVMVVIKTRRIKLKLLRSLIVLPLLFCGVLNAKGRDNLKLLEVRKIWDSAPHNAFTDLERFNGKWYCAFREGKGHAGGGDYGKVRVIVSDDGQMWESAALFETNGVDLRDAKLSVTPGGLLLLNSCEYRVDDDKSDVRNNISVTYSSKDGIEWSGPTKIADKGYWLWQTTWIKDTGYALGYQWGNRDATRLYRTTDGESYTMHVDHIRPPGDRSNEHSMLFDNNGRAHMLLRRDNANSEFSGYALLGQADAPYKDWEWRRLNITVGGPSMIQLSDGRIIACVRRYADENHRNWGSQWTEVGWIEPETATYTAAVQLPSGGDSSYAGLVWYRGRLWISYYSSHEVKTSIYLAKLEIPGVK